MPPQKNNKVIAAAIAVAVWFLLMLWFAASGYLTKAQARKRPANPDVLAAVKDLERKQKDPRVVSCFKAAFEMAKQYRQKGRAKPSDAELHSIGTSACDHFKVPNEMRGVAIEKFKSGFGCGWSSGR